MKSSSNTANEKPSGKTSASGTDAQPQTTPKTSRKARTLRKVKSLLENADALVSEAKRLSSEFPLLLESIHQCNLAIGDADATADRV